jgi:hypothetical protein
MDGRIMKTARMLVPAILMAATFTLAPMQPAFAAPPTPAPTPTAVFLPVGTDSAGCPDFNLGISWSGGNLHTKEFTDKGGNVVRIITAGKGFDVTYTNLGTDPDNPVEGESVTVRTPGSVNKIVNNPDGTQTVTATGHNGLVLFPTDVPAGPTTTHYIGRIVYNVDPATGVFTLVSTTGQQRDICAELAS